MKLVFSSSPSHDILKRHVFLGTLCEPWELIELRFRVPGEGNHLSPGWKRVIIERIGLMHEFVRRHCEEVVVFSDVDIQWFRPAQAIVLHELGDRDIVFQQENAEKPLANFGFLCVRCNERSAALFALLERGAMEGRFDQDIVNELIAEGRMPCRFGFLPPTFLNDDLISACAPSPDDIVLYHSTITMPRDGKTSVQIKLEKHLAMRARMLASGSILRSLPGIGSTVQKKAARFQSERAEKPLPNRVQE